LIGYFPEYETNIAVVIGKGHEDGFDTLEDALRESKLDLEELHREQNSSLGSVGVYEKILSVGKEKGHCLACNRKFQNDEFTKFTNHVSIRFYESHLCTPG
jgi:hypothetical protein